MCFYYNLVILYYIVTYYTVPIFHDVKVVKILVPIGMLFGKLETVLCARKVVLNTMANLKW